jgi:hypothetical protein
VGVSWRKPEIPILLYGNTFQPLMKTVDKKRLIGRFHNRLQSSSFHKGIAQEM